MRAKDLVIDFINFLFVLIVICFCIVYFVYKDNFETFIHIITALAPISFFAILFLIRLKSNRKEFLRRRSHGDLEMDIKMTYADKIALDLILFSSPIIVLALPFFRGLPDLIDFIQAMSVFLIFYCWQRYLFSHDSQ